MSFCIYPDELSALVEILEKSQGTSFGIERSVFGGIDVAVDEHPNRAAEQNWIVRKGVAEHTQTNGTYI